ncbi:MAG: S8/S53 family peptidase, partial [Pseudonocardia sp.]|nr:S8/S53 family peptidase [Pseudonocardia sp.]
MVEIQAFDPAPKEHREPEQIRREREVVAEQITRWLAERAEIGVQALESRAVERFVARRSGTALPPFEEDGDSGALVVPGRVVVLTDALDDAQVGLDHRRQLGESGLFAVTVPGLEGVRVLEEVAAPRRRRSARETIDIARGVLGDGAEIAKCHMFPLSAVYKADGGPEPSGPAGGEEPWTPPVEDVRGPKVVVIDTGVSAEQRADGWLVGLARADNLDLLDVVPVDDFLDLAAGHGQFVAGVIQRVAPGADLDVLRGLDTDGFGDEVELARLIVAAARAGARIINLSLGTFTADDRPPLLLQQALR